MQKEKPQRRIIKMNFAANQGKNEPDGNNIFFQSNLLSHFEQKGCHNKNEDQPSQQFQQNKNQEIKDSNIFQCKEHKSQAIFVCQDNSCTSQSKQGCSKCMNIYHYNHSNVIMIEGSQQMEDDKLAIQKQTASIKQQFMRFQKMIKAPTETLQNESTHQSVNKKDSEQQQYQQKQQQQVIKCQKLGKFNSQINQTEEKLFKKNKSNTHIAIDVNQAKEIKYSKNLFLQGQQINYSNEAEDIPKNTESIIKIHMKQNDFANQTKNIDFANQNNAKNQNLSESNKQSNSEQKLVSSYKVINPIENNINQRDNQLINIFQNTNLKISNSNQIETQQKEIIQKLSIPSFENTQNMLELKNQLVFLPTQYIPCYSYIPPQFPTNYFLNTQPSQVQYVSQSQMFIPQSNIQQNIIQNISNFQNYAPYNFLNTSIQPQINNTQQQVYSAWIQPQTFNQNNLNNEYNQQKCNNNNYFIQNNLNLNDQHNYEKNQLINLRSKKQLEELDQVNNNNLINQQLNQNDIYVTSLSVNQQSDQAKNSNHQIINPQLIETKNIDFSQKSTSKSQQASQNINLQQQLAASAYPIQQKHIEIQAPQNVKIEAIESKELQYEKSGQKAVVDQQSEILEKDQLSQQISKQSFVTLKQEEQDQQRNISDTFQIERVQLRSFSCQAQQRQESVTLNKIEPSKNIQQQQSIEKIQLVPYRATQFSIKSACNPNGSKKVNVQYFIDNNCMKSQYTSIDKVIHQHIDYYPQITFLSAECFLQISVNTFEMKYYLNLVDIKQKKISQRREASGIFQCRNSSIFEENKLVIQKINNNISALYERGENQVDFISNSTLKVVKRLKQYSIQKVISYNNGRGLAIASLSGLVTLYNINCNKFSLINQFNVKNIKSKYMLQQNLNQNPQNEQQEEIVNQEDQDENHIQNEERRRQGAHYEKFTFILNCDIFIQDNKLIWCGSSLFKFTYCIVDITSSAKMILEPTQANYPDGMINNDQLKIQISNLHVFNDRVYFEFSYIGKESDQFQNNQNSSSVLLQSKYTVLQYKMNKQEDNLQLTYYSIHPNSNIIKVSDPQNQIFLYNQQKAHIIGILFEKQPKKKQQQILNQGQIQSNNDKRMVIVDDIAYFSSLFKERRYKENYEEVKFKMNVSQFQNSQTLYILLNSNSSTSCQNQKFITLVDNKKIFHKVFLSQSQYTTKIK
ncbi:hypothetical protein TTHERM_00149600 (macronuclear) [Tetrahymena thermophila SB210]|uniref:Uncharacterized protein n=1 Tax=Tetrahymena thermophila (strain SB210) TaxID=312017 RepID=I7MGD3_TETTS|nr:hypothetical protein TTHERM_00149600 [Tetrahymena thermophila SB210]EAS01350.2 hypothetical protein TTHERM_00149600 [Tetrahymena thermophila SB210]|eukprot:XP_001021595.2 hypothetical protein TTHERM_00149600 [Tetrahymena thermophila SB210]